MKYALRMIAASLLVAIAVLAQGCGKDNPPQPGPNIAPEKPAPPMGGGTVKPKNASPAM